MLPAPGEVRYLKSNPTVDARTASKRIIAPEPTAGAGAHGRRRRHTVATPPTTTTDDAARHTPTTPPTSATAASPTG